MGLFKKYVQKSFVEEKYISYIIKISNNRILTLGSSIKIWHLNNEEKSISPKNDIYIVIKMLLN